MPNTAPFCELDGDSALDHDRNEVCCKTLRPKNLYPLKRASWGA